MEQKLTGSIFEIGKLVKEPLIIKTANYIKELGFHLANPDTQENSLQNLRIVFADTILLADNKTGPILLSSNHPVIDEKRATLPIPQTVVLEKDSAQYYSLVLDPKVNLILNSTPIDSIMRNGKKVTGFVIEHILLSGNSQRSLDLLSLQIGQPVKNIFTFSGFSPFYTYKRVYSNPIGNVALPTYTNDLELFDEEVRNGGQVFDPEVLLSIPTKEGAQGQLLWNPSIFPYISIHEGGHGTDDSLMPHNKKDGSIYLERRANALSLQLIRWIARKYPQDSFFDPKNAREIYHNQMADY